MKTLLKTLTSLLHPRQFTGILAVVFAFTVIFCVFDKDHFSGIDDEESIGDRIFNRVYFVLTTVSTVGYGDVYAKSKEARGVVMVLLIVTTMSYIAKVEEALNVRRSGLLP